MANGEIVFFDLSVVLPLVCAELVSLYMLLGKDRSNNKSKWPFWARFSCGGGVARGVVLFGPLNDVHYVKYKKRADVYQTIPRILARNLTLSLTLSSTLNSALN